MADTNVLISALVGHGKPRRLVTLLLDRHQLVSSPQMLAEFVDVTLREEFADLGRARVASFLSILARRAAIVPVKHVVDAVEEDPDDNIVLSTALRGNASMIVSGDGHLLGLKRFRGVRTVTVQETLEMLGGSSVRVLAFKGPVNIDLFRKASSPMGQSSRKMAREPRTQREVDRKRDQTLERRYARDRQESTLFVMHYHAEAVVQSLQTLSFISTKDFSWSTPVQNSPDFLSCQV